MLTEQDREELREMTEVGWVEACRARDWDAAVALLTEDVDYMAADLPLLKGREAVREFLAEFPELVDFHQNLVEAQGDTSLAVLRATFGGTFRVEEQEVTGVGKVLSTATKQDGSWHFAAVCWNWDAPPALLV
jgi:ketosteroid isomerase-like protein